MKIGVYYCFIQPSAGPSLSPIQNPRVFSPPKPESSLSFAKSRDPKCLISPTQASDAKLSHTHLQTKIIRCHLRPASHRIASPVSIGASVASFASTITPPRSMAATPVDISRRRGAASNPVGRRGYRRQRRLRR
ncbi:hypothetical protein V8G54_005149 [Vigna mungo]|uniref:Uncharacterized protein n=1 Tax=Vigna mungo TaxID=3915 RepID=A0AAQ3PG76_VIGMU